MMYKNLFDKAKRNPRKRFNQQVGLKKAGGKKVFEMIDAVYPESYIRPHWQLSDVEETLTCLYGSAYIIFFTRTGRVEKIKFVDGKGRKKITIKPGVIHSVIVTSQCVFRETMSQPKGRLYDARLDKIYADWAPAENANKKTIQKYMQKVLSACFKLHAIDLYADNWWENFLSHFKFWEEPYEAVNQRTADKGAVVELGCGEGLLSNYLALVAPNRKIIGYEIVPERLEIAKKGIANTIYRVGDVVKVPFPKADVFILFHVLHHLPSKQAQEDVLIKVKKALKPGGKLLIVDVHMGFTLRYFAAWIADHFLVPWVFEKRFFTRAYFRSESEWRQLLKKLGYKFKVSEETEGRPFPNILFDCVIGK